VVYSIDRGEVFDRYIAGLEPRIRAASSSLVSANCREVLVNKTVWAFGLAWLLTLSTATQSQQPQAPAADYPSWAFPLKVRNGFRRQGRNPMSLPGSPADTHRNRIDDLLKRARVLRPASGPASDHPQGARRTHWRCGACHLLSGSATGVHRPHGPDRWRTWFNR